MSKKKFVKTIAKSQISAGIGSAIDFLTFGALVKFGGMYYVLARAIGAAVGAVTNFNLNRHWTWRTGHTSLGPEAIRYAVVSAGSLILNTFGTWLLTENSNLTPLMSALVVSLVVALGYNFIMHKLFVFKS